MRTVLITTAAILGIAACSQAPTPAAVPETEPQLKVWTFEAATIVPADRSLVRPESGVVLADGTLIVADQRHGLIALSADGNTRPFGNFAAAGYVHAPPEAASAPNGVSFEPGKTHLLVADIFTGSLYRVDLAAETTTLLYDHPFGMNYAHKDSTGAIWFTQSTENAAPDSEKRMFAAVDVAMSDGALYRIAPAAAGEPLPAPELKLSGLDFANGFVVDETRGQIFLSETVGGHVLGLEVDVGTGSLGARRVVATVTSPDNIEQDEDGLLWVASPMSNELLQINPDTGEVRTVFHPASAAGEGLAVEFRRRVAAGEPALELLGPDVWGPLPGLMTGVILSPGSGPIYISGLGDALVKLDR